MPVTDNTKLMARVPVIPDDFQNKQEHKDHELVMDFDNEFPDLYVKINGEYINITGQIRDSVKDIQDGSMVVHIVTEDTLPPVKERPENHWYYVITKSEEYGSQEEVLTETYIYYGVIQNDYSTNDNYLLLAQQVFTGDTAYLTVILPDNTYTACFYVPITLSPTFTNNDTGELYSYEVVDRLYALNTSTGSYVAYDVYMLNMSRNGETHIAVDLSGGDYFTISFESNEPDIEGLQLPESMEVKDGFAIGSIPDPVWNEPRYIFTGWSTNRIIYEPIDPSTYKPEKDMVLFAWFEFDASANKLEYYATYVSNSGNSLMTMSLDNESTEVSTVSNPKILGTYCSIANQDEVIPAKKFAGYITPNGQALKEDKEQLVYLYDTETYNIAYELDGGSFKDSANPKSTYTVEDANYIPPTPYKEGYDFVKWSPASIPTGSTGDKTLVAIWKVRTCLLQGSQLNEMLSNIGITAGITESVKDQVMAIQMSKNLPNDSSIVPKNISRTANPVYAWWVDDAKSILIYSESDIYCDSNMSGALEGFSNLRDISGLYYWNCSEGADISNLFKDCIMLSDTDMVNEWANGKFSDFTGAFQGTAAMEAGRVPSWYRWGIKLYHASINGPILENASGSYIPDQVVYAKNFTGYTSPEYSLTLSEKDKEYVFNYDPKKYTIDYVLNGGIIADAKETYTIEDATYYPPTPYKEGYSFNGWTPECITHGEYGNKRFVASFTKLANDIEDY